LKVDKKAVLKVVTMVVLSATLKVVMMAAKTASLKVA
jgi:hypothetical protein